MNVCNKLECLPLQPNLVFQPRLDWSQEPTNIRLDWKGLKGTNTLVYNEHLQISYVNFYNIGPLNRTSSL